MPLTNPSVITAGEMPGGGAVDRSAAGLQFQHYQMGLTATGAMLGKGRRSVPDPSAQFSMSGAQFGGGGSAKATFSSSEEAE